MSEPETLTVDINGYQTRIWRKGSGPKLGYLAGFGGLPRWMPFLDELAKTRTVIVPSVPGFPGGDRGHSILDSHLDWLLALRNLLEKADLIGADLAGSSVGASLAAEMAALWPASVRRLALIAPFGLFDDREPAADPWAQRKEVLPGLMCADGEKWNALVAPPDGANSVEWPIEMTRASEAAARAFWPLGNTGLHKRLGLIASPTLILWGDRDALLPPSYAQKFATRINGGINGGSRVELVADAGHLAYLDQPETVARAVLGHFR